MEFKRLQRTVKLNGRDLVADIVIRVEEDDYTPRAGADFDTGDAEADKAYEKRFEPNGDLFNAVIFVTATAHGVEGSDVLGGCHISCNNMFNSEPFNKDVELVLEEHAMISNAVIDLAEQVKARAKDLAPYA